MFFKKCAKITSDKKGLLIEEKIKLYRVPINYRYNFQSLSKFYILRYFHLICFTVKENASSFFFLNRYLWK